MGIKFSSEPSSRLSSDSNSRGKEMDSNSNERRHSRNRVRRNAGNLSG